MGRVSKKLTLALPVTEGKIIERKRQSLFKPYDSGRPACFVDSHFRVAVPYIRLVEAARGQGIPEEPCPLFSSVRKRFILYSSIIIMSISYEEALSTLQAMFGEPWTRESLDAVLRHFQG